MTVINTNIAETINIEENGTYDVARYTTANVSVGGGYKVLDRVKDDNNNDIGCVVGFHTDANNQKYAVVCLNRQYRSSSNFSILSTSATITGVPTYNNIDVYCATETATKNCDEILATATAEGATSTAVNECRSRSFVIGGVTYYGQVPTLQELMSMFFYKTHINSTDPSTTGPQLNITQYDFGWASNRVDTSAFWSLGGNGLTNMYRSQSNGQKVFPILEIPIQ